MIIHVNETYLLLNYLITIVVSIVVALGLGLPLLPKKPRRFSWDVSAIFPTPIFAIGLLAIFISLNFIWIYGGIVLSVILGLISALFTKYLFDYVFPKPPEENESTISEKPNSNEEESL